MDPEEYEEHEAVVAPKSSTSVQKYMKRAHYSSISISLAVNALLVVALLTFITFAAPNEKETTQVMVIDPTEAEIIEEIEEEIEPEEIVDPEEITEITDFTLDMELDTTFEPTDEVVDTPVDTEVSALTDLMSDVSSPVVMTGLLVGRPPRSRAAAMKRYGQGVGGVAEKSVLKALEWLRDNQNEDGSWNRDGGANGQGQNVGYVGLALLTFLAHGETPSSADFGEAVAKAIRYLVENQSSDGRWGRKLSGKHTSYGHAMATYALAEAYTMTENPLLLEPLQKSLKVLMDGQQPQGGFDYDYKLENRNDLSVAAWNVQAMKAASISGVGGEQLRKAFPLGVDGMLTGSKSSDSGLAFAYTVGGKANRVVSAAGTLCLFLGGRSKSAEARQAINHLEAEYINNNHLPEWNGAQNGTYGGQINEWYYAVQAIFQDNPEGPNFKKYYPALVKALAQNQASDGHWLCYGERGQKQGKVYNTTLGALGLMVTYRYLPTTQADNIKAYSPEVAPMVTEQEDEVGFDI